MIGEDLRANAEFPIQEPTKIAYLFLAVVVLITWILGSVISSSLSL